jgi:hypothetical protein
LRSSRWTRCTRHWAPQPERPKYATLSDQQQYKIPIHARKTN